MFHYTNTGFMYYYDTERDRLTFRCATAPPLGVFAAFSARDLAREAEAIERALRNLEGFVSHVAARAERGGTMAPDLEDCFLRSREELAFCKLWWIELQQALAARPLE
jgi:hypothetical protein